MDFMLLKFNSNTEVSEIKSLLKPGDLYQMKSPRGFFYRGKEYGLIFVEYRETYERKYLEFESDLFSDVFLFYDFVENKYEFFSMNDFKNGFYVVKI
jgi:hypothetical protein